MSKVLGFGKLIMLGIIGMIAFQSCATTGYSLVEPHYYNNSFEQVIKGIEMVLRAENMVVTNDERLDDKTFKIYFFKKSARIDEQDFEAGHTAEITVKLVGPKKTSVHIKEQKTRALVRDDYREHLARDVFKGINEVLVLIPKETLQN